MFFLRLALTALRSLEANFMRSLLATLGVLIGVGSVVACMSILEGASKDVIKRFKALGSNALYIVPRSAEVEGRRVGTAQTLIPDDMDTLMRALENKIAGVAPEAFGSATVKRFQKSDEFALVATSHVYFEMNAYQAARGRTFTRSESNDELALVACLGSKVAEKIFGDTDPVGQTVKIGGSAYRVLAVMEKKGNIGFLNADRTVYVPIQAGLKRFFNRRWLSQVSVFANDGIDLEDLKKEVSQTLRAAHSIPVGQKDDFEIYSQEEIVQNVSQFLFIWKAVFYSIAGISLVVGGIGIMNIMLVSVTERTREIGVRIAVGARRLDILLQFLVESVCISLLGGGFGLLLGAMCSDLMNRAMKEFEFNTAITSVVVATALITTSAVGILSGIYPAWKASRLDPVEALRYE